LAFPGNLASYQGAWHDLTKAQRRFCIALSVTLMTSSSSPALVQKLKVHLLDQRQGKAPATMLDCGAHMLLNFDQPHIMYRVALRFLLERFNATRVDFGFGKPDQDIYVPNAVETVSGLEVPRFEEIYRSDIWPVQQVWHAPGPVYQSLERCPGIGEYWAPIGTKSKIARRLESDGELFGLICVDDTDEQRNWETAELNYFDQFVSEFFTPIVRAQLCAEKPVVRAQLSNAEIGVVRLAVSGLSYKEVARRLGKSPNTIDNQLRSARAKLNVRNQVELAQAYLKWL
jgi:DNA-binding CsgD family transcriptional regulator